MAIVRSSCKRQRDDLWEIVKFDRTARAVSFYFDNEYTALLRMPRTQLTEVIRVIVTTEADCRDKVHVELLRHLDLKRFRAGDITRLSIWDGFLKEDSTISDDWYIELVTACGMEGDFIESIIAALESEEEELHQYCRRMVALLLKEAATKVTKLREGGIEATYQDTDEAVLYLTLLAVIYVKLREEQSLMQLSAILSDCSKDPSIPVLKKVNVFIRLIGSLLCLGDNFEDNPAIAELIDVYKLSPLEKLLKDQSKNLDVMRRLFRSNRHSLKKLSSALLGTLLDVLVSMLMSTAIPIPEDLTDSSKDVCAVMRDGRIRLYCRLEIRDLLQNVGNCAYLVTLLLDNFKSRSDEGISTGKWLQNLMDAMNFWEQHKSRPDFERIFGTARIEFQDFMQHLNSGQVMLHKLPLWHSKFFELDEAFLSPEWYAAAENVVVPNISKDVGIQQLTRILEDKKNLSELDKRLAISISTSKNLVSDLADIAELLFSNRPYDILTTATFMEELHEFCAKKIGLSCDWIGSGTQQSIIQTQDMYNVMLQQPLVAGFHLLHRCMRLPPKVQTHALEALLPFWRLTYAGEYLLKACARKFTAQCAGEVGNLRSYESFVPSVLGLPFLGHLEYFDMLMDAFRHAFIEREDTKMDRLLKMIQCCGAYIQASEKSLDDFRKEACSAFQSCILFSYSRDWNDCAGPIIRDRLHTVFSSIVGSDDALFDTNIVTEEIDGSLSFSSLLLACTRLSSVRKETAKDVTDVNLASEDLDVVTFEEIIRNSSSGEMHHLLESTYWITRRKYGGGDNTVKKWLNFVSQFVLLQGSTQVPRGMSSNEDNGSRKSMSQAAFLVYQEYGKALLGYLLDGNFASSLLFRSKIELQFQLLKVFATCLISFPDERRMLPARRIILTSLFKLVQFMVSQGFRNDATFSQCLLCLLTVKRYLGTCREFLPMVDTMLRNVSANLTI